MYQVDDLVVYGSAGVCRVVEIREQAFPGTGEKQLYYSLRPLYENGSVSVPVNSDKVFLRPVISREEAEKMIDTIPSVHAKAFHSKASRELTEHYESLLKSHDCHALLELTMSIYVKKKDLESRKKKFGSVDERFLKRAENLLFGELAAALQITKEQVPTAISDRIHRLTNS